MKRTAAAISPRADDAHGARRARVSTAIHVSSDPLILLYEAFVSSSECEMLLAMSKAVRERDDGSCELVDSEEWTAAQRQLVSQVEARIGQLTCCPPHDEEPPLLLL